MPSFDDKMSMNDKPLSAVLSCAKCGRPVESGKAHLCGFIDRFSGSSGVDAFLTKKEKTNESKD